MAQAFLRSSQRSGQFLNLSRRLLRPFQFGPIVDQKLLLRQYPVIQRSNALRYTAARGGLMISGVEDLPDEAYRGLLDYEKQAAALGYPQLR